MTILSPSFTDRKAYSSMQNSFPPIWESKCPSKIDRLFGRFFSSTVELKLKFSKWFDEALVKYLQPSPKISLCLKVSWRHPSWSAVWISVGKEKGIPKTSHICSTSLGDFGRFLGSFHSTSYSSNKLPVPVPNNIGKINSNICPTTLSFFTNTSPFETPNTTPPQKKHGSQTSPPQKKNMATYNSCVQHVWVEKAEVLRVKYGETWRQPRWISINPGFPPPMVKLSTADGKVFSSEPKKNHPSSGATRRGSGGKWRKEQKEWICKSFGCFQK